MNRRLRIAARPAEPGAPAKAELVLERLDFARETLEALCDRTGVDESALRDGRGWTAEVELEGTVLLLCSEDGERWSIFAPPGTDEADAAQAARKLHGALAAQHDDWDLDR